MRLKCHKCKTIGHLAKMCRSKQKPISAQPSKLISASEVNNSFSTNLVKIRVANHPSLAMTDSGAHISAISANFYRQNLRNKITLEKTFLSVSGVSGAPLKVNGKINVSIEIGRLTLQQSFYVTKIVDRMLY